MNNNLTKRELEILQATADGKANKQIGNENTVKRQSQCIFLKLGANCKANAVAIGFRMGIIK